MNKMSLVRKRKEAYVEIKIESGQSLNNREYEFLRSKQSDYLLQADANKKNIRYNISEYISLSEYFKSVTSKDRFLTAISYMLEGIRESQSLQLLELKRFVLDKDYIFVSRQDKRICFIYFPIINEDNKFDVKEFFNTLAFNTVFNQMEDCSYVTQYIQYFKQHLDFSLYDFENFINGLRGGARIAPTNINGAIQSKPVMQSGASNGVYVPDFNQSVAHPSKLLSQVEKKVKYCTKCKRNVREKDVFCCFCGASVVEQVKVYNPNEEYHGVERRASMLREGHTMVEAEPRKKPKVAGTSVLGVQNDVGGTTVLSPEELVVSVPKITRISNNDVADITKQDYVIGQSTGNADFCVNGNTAVSREHAHIVSQNGNYYIVDYKSTNGTYVNNCKIEKGVMVELTDGTIFKLANEEFKFEV